MSGIKPKAWIADAAQAVEDAELFAAGRRAADKGQCPSVIVATYNDIRNYHNCDADEDRAHAAHGCGCGQTWRQGTEGQGMVSTGPLSDVVFS